jgi:hypothetical protein
MAKCVVDKSGRVWRVSAKEAAEIVERGGYYITKSEMQRAVNGQWTPPAPTNTRARERVAA